MIKFISNVRLWFSLACMGGLYSGLATADISQNAGLKQFIQEMHSKHGYSKADLERLFAQVTIQDSILKAMDKPYEAKPWYEYRKLFLTEKRIAGGRLFLQQNQAAFKTAYQKYGVPAVVIAAIIGIETSYGDNPGKYKVIDALSTLAFAYPKRAGFFRQELEAFLMLCREEKLAPEQPIGSYAGAMGLPQFMPSSFRAYAVDGNDDGRRDIWHDPADAIASVAHYLARNGWMADETVAVPAQINKKPPFSSGKVLKAEYSISQLAQLGVKPVPEVAGSLRGNLVALEGSAEMTYWLGFQNFYAITRYNHSALYAMAAHQLSQELQLPNGPSGVASP
ncbi:MAG: lytic murein transglycosylase B [Methylococcaceae bacterium]